MAASSRGMTTVSSLIKSSRHPRLCSNCISSLRPSPRPAVRPLTHTHALARFYAVAAATLRTSDGAQHHDPTIAALPPVTQTSTASPTGPYAVHSGVVLSRPPLLTRPLGAFESAFYFYQKRLNERLAMPFTRYFYFKPDQPGDAEWKRKARARGGGSAARELGSYSGYGAMSWNDELLVGDETSAPRKMYEALVKDAEVKVEEGDVAGRENAVEMPRERFTEADVKGDLRSLDRKLARTLYLCVKRADGSWGFPAGEVVGKENLHQAAERILVQTAGVNMNTWIVGHAPIGHRTVHPASEASASTPTNSSSSSTSTTTTSVSSATNTTTAATPDSRGTKTFFMKARIMAGQADLKDNALGAVDFRWLTAQEVRAHVGAAYFSDVRGVFAER